VPSPADCEETIPRGLVLPEGQSIPGDTDDKEYVLFSLEEYRTIVHIYNGYVMYDENREYIDRIKALDVQIEMVRDQRLTLCLDTKNYLKTQVDDMFKIWGMEHQLRLKEENKSKFREVFVGLGTGVAGLILGAAVGVIWMSAAK
jgi:hypothetical protein